MDKIQELYYSIVEKYYSRHLDFRRNEIVFYKGENLRVGEWLLIKKIEYRKGNILDKRLMNIFRRNSQLSTCDTWYLMYDLLCNYYDDNQHINVPYLYKYQVLDNSVDLGRWVIYQRNLYNNGKLSANKVELLNKLGMNWKLRSRNEWDYYYGFACDYYQAYHHLNIPTSYEIMDGNQPVKLGTWLCNQKRNYRKGLLEEERVKALENIGIFWSEKEEKEKIFPIILKKYFEENGNINITEHAMYVYNRRSYPLGRWVYELRRARREGLLDLEMENLLEKYNIVWDVFDYSWKKMYSLACNYYKQNGNLLIPRSYSVTEGGKKYHVGKWIASQRYSYKLKTLDKSKINMLENIGMLWTIKCEKMNWFEAFSYAKDFYDEHGHLNIPVNYQVDGYKLGYWIISQKRMYFKNRLDSRKKELLESIGIVWYVRNNNWMMMFETLKSYQESFKSLNEMKDFLPEREYQKLVNWMKAQRMAYQEGKIDASKLSLLNSIGFVFSVNDVKWQSKYAIAKKFYEENHHLNVSKYYVIMLDGKVFYLASWLQRQRLLYNCGDLSEDKTKLLNEIGIVWSLEDLWNKNYALAKEYYLEHGELKIKYNYVVSTSYGEIKLGKWIYTQRSNYKEGLLSPDRIAKLEQIGMLWACKNDDLREICQEYGIDYDKYGRSIRCNTKELLLAKIIYMQKNNIPFVTSTGRFSRIFSMSATNFSLKFNVDIEKLVKEIKGVQKCL